MLYIYGPLAWVWRLLILFGFMLGAGALWASIAMSSAVLVMGAFALLGPALFFGMVVAVRAEQVEDGALIVRTLLFVSRRVGPAGLGPPRVRIWYESLPGPLHAPRVWVPVKGGPPLYFDLLAHIPDRPALLAALGLRADEIRQAS